MATDTFRHSTDPDIGMLIRKSQCSRVRRLAPLPSDPITTPRGPVRSVSYSDSSARSEVPAIHTPSSLRISMERTRLVTDAKGTLSAPPQATFRTVSVMGEERSLGATTRHTPAASAVRRMAPRLWGSCT